MDIVIIQLGLGKLGPNLWLIDTFSKSFGAIKSTKIVNKHFHSRLVKGTTLFGGLGILTVCERGGHRVKVSRVRRKPDERSRQLDD